MKNGVISLGMIALLLLAGCGKDKKKTTAAATFDADTRTSHAFAENANEEEDRDFIGDELEEYDEMAFAFDDDEYDDIERDELFNPEAEEAAFAALVDEDEELLEGEDVRLEDEPQKFAFHTVKFDFNYANVDAKENALKEDVELARQAVEAGKKVVLQGHCCQMGAPSFNMALSVKRAKAVKDVFVANGIDADKIEVMGFGSELPLVWTDATDRDEKVADLAANRRVEVVVI